jgi:nicotinamidase-related amidase
MVAISDGKILSRAFGEFGSPALIVSNMQNGIVSRGVNKQRVLPTIRALVNTAHKTGIPVVFSQYHRLPLKWLELGLKDVLLDGEADELTGGMRLGSSEGKIVSSLRPDETDLILPCHTPSLFVDTPLEHVLRNYGADTIILVGATTHMSILLTARHAIMRGFAVVLVEDAIDYAQEDAHQRAMRFLHQACDVLPASEVTARLQRNDEMERLPTPLLGLRLRSSDPMDLDPSSSF